MLYTPSCFTNLMAKTTSINLVNGIGALSILEGSGALSAISSLVSGTGTVQSAVSEITQASLDRANQAQVAGTVIGILALKKFTKGQKVVGKLAGLEFRV